MAYIIKKLKKNIFLKILLLTIFKELKILKNKN